MQFINVMNVKLKRIKLQEKTKRKLKTQKKSERKKDK